MIDDKIVLQHYYAKKQIKDKKIIQVLVDVSFIFTIITYIISKEYIIYSIEFSNEMKFFSIALIILLCIDIIRITILNDRAENIFFPLIGVASFLTTIILIKFRWMTIIPFIIFGIGYAKHKNQIYRKIIDYSASFKAKDQTLSQIAFILIAFSYPITKLIGDTERTYVYIMYILLFFTIYNASPMNKTYKLYLQNSQYTLQELNEALRDYEKKNGKIKDKRNCKFL